MLDKQKDRKRNTLSHLQFAQAVDCLRKHKQEFLDLRPDKADAAQQLSRMLGFPISAASVNDLKEASGAKWEARRGEGNSTKVNASVSLAVVARALERLYRKLDEEPPQGLTDLVERYKRREAETP